ncbi:IS200/IS605 family transposase [Niabella yanshanensis]|uniref:IS200/IS605 family transposase n=1 Tax=Niabella yanshanensis TaxID=577386 RepID=A0ABZ0WB28_9BACT|nr:IS200/IS605 family transposase [Niabella yanshanensis]WQD40149.1 IS200/IS605 family transposase [Niabella yanshanensis]
MANTYTKLYIQIVFAVKGRASVIREEFRDELQKYMTGIIQNKKQKLYAIYCMPDHVHIFVSMGPELAISDLVRDVKANATSFINDKGWVEGYFEWQRGFGAFSYSESQVKAVVNYVLNQREHHEEKTFREEYIELLNQFEVDFDNKYLFEFLE